MKSSPLLALLLAGSLAPFLAVTASAQSPAYSLSQNLASWYTADSARYARIYETWADEQARNAVTTWDNGTYQQAVPAYGGVQEIDYNTDSIYVRTTGLAAGHVMGPWYNDTGPGGSEVPFQNWPESIRTWFRIPAQPAIPATRTKIPGGAIGVMIDGTLIFSSSDTFSYNNNENGTGTGADTGPGTNSGIGDGIWSHDAFISEGNTFDKSNAHAAGNQLHYHASPMKLRRLLGDSVDATTQANGEVLYTEHFNGKHSPILGWMVDGLPLYGPYGYSSPSDPASGVRRMVSGFLIRDGSHGTYNLTANGRHALPAWAARFQGKGTVNAANPQDQYDLTTNQWGPTIVTATPLPYYMEDYAYKGDLTAYSYYNGIGTFNEAQHYDLNEQNARFCVTPEFPSGTWAYFTNIDASGNPAFPYNVAVQYYGNPANGGSVASLPTGLTQKFKGGPDIAETPRSLDRGDGNVVITWNAAEGGSYTVQSSAALDSWTTTATGVVAGDNILSVTDTPAAGEGSKYYHLSRTALAAYDDGSGNTGGLGGGGGGGGGGGNTTFNATFATTPALPPQGAVTSIIVGGVTATITSYTQATGAVTVTFDNTTLAAGSYPAKLTFTPPGQSAVVRNSTNNYVKP